MIEVLSNWAIVLFGGLLLIIVVAGFRQRRDQDWHTAPYDLEDADQDELDHLYAEAIAEQQVLMNLVEADPRLEPREKLEMMNYILEVDPEDLVEDLWYSPGYRYSYRDVSSTLEDYWDEMGANRD